MDDYIISYNKNKSHENLLFNHILDLINNKYIIVDGININHKFIQGEYIFFKKNNKEIIKISKNEYYLLGHSSHKENKEYPYYGSIINIDGDKLKIKCSLEHKLDLIIKDEITIHQSKIIRIYNAIYENKKKENTLQINKDDIFKKITKEEWDKKTTDELLEYSINGKRILNPNIEEKIISKKIILIKEDEPDKDYGNDLISTFINKLIININNGKEINNLNYLIDDNINISIIEKYIPTSEIFYKHNKDKDKMKETFNQIFIKQSDFINITNLDNTKIKKPILTKKLKDTPYTINKLFGYNSSILFNIDGSGDDSYSISNVLDKLKINQRFNQVEEDSHRNDLHQLIIKGIGNKNNKFYNNESELINEYNNYNKLRDKLRDKGEGNKNGEVLFKLLDGRCPPNPSFRGKHNIAQWYKCFIIVLLIQRSLPIY